MNILRSLAAITFISLSGLAAAQSANPPVTTPHERVEARHDNSIAAHHALQRARYQLHRAQRAHDYKRVAAIRRHIHRERMALRHDRFEHRHELSSQHRG